MSAMKSKQPLVDMPIPSVTVAVQNILRIPFLIAESAAPCVVVLQGQAARETPFGIDLQRMVGGIREISGVERAAKLRIYDDPVFRKIIDAEQPAAITNGHLVQEVREVAD